MGRTRLTSVTRSKAIRYTCSRFPSLCISQTEINESQAKAQKPLQFAEKIERAVKLGNRIDSTPE